MSKRSILISGLVLIALVAAGTLAAMAMSTDEPEGQQAYTAADDGTAITVPSGATFTVVLEGNPTTGYGWEATGIDPAVIAVAEPEYQSDSDLIGAGGRYTFTFTAVGSGETEVRLVYHRPWESAEPLETFTLTVTVP